MTNRRRHFLLRFVLACMVFIVGVPGQGATGAIHRALAQSAVVPPVGDLPPEFFLGTWETRNTEQGRDVRIIWTLKPDRSLDYEFEVDGDAFKGSSGTWDYRGGVMHERWSRPDGTAGMGRGRIERIDDDTIGLTIIDNGDPSYTGLVRIYRRRGPPGLS